jgi:ariadne-1
VEDNRRVKWCPSVPHCGHCVVIPPNQSKHVEVVCLCGKSFCFACGNDSHSPLSCGMFQKWRKKCEDDSETANWIAANTKECPKCGCLVNKNGGCHHVTCVKCNSCFCWVRPSA